MSLSIVFPTAAGVSIEPPGLMVLEMMPVGTRGPTGPAGSTGAAGAPGVAGAPGPQGPAGAYGADGAQGPQGEVGAQGATGPQGIQGPPGADGADGADGATGAQGPQGVPGVDGAAGATGATGATGPQGATGATGAQGPQGVQGATGATGSTGATGPAGPIAGTDKQGVFNDAGVAAGSADFTFDKTAKKLYGQKLVMAVGTYPYSTTGGALYAGANKIIESAGNSTAFYNYADQTSPYFNLYSGAMNLRSTVALTWTSGTDPVGTVDSGLIRTSAGVVEVNNGTSGTLRDLKLRHRILTGLPATGQAATTIASAATIAPTLAIHFVSGTAAIATITAPSPISAGGGQIVLIPTGLFTTTTAGNIALATTAVVGRALTMTYDTTAAKWYPSY